MIFVIYVAFKYSQISLYFSFRMDIRYFCAKVKNDFFLLSVLDENSILVTLCSISFKWK